MKKLGVILMSCFLLLAGCTSATNQNSKNMTITIFNAGKADAILFSTPEGYVLMDTGLDDNKATLVDDLEEMGVKELYALIITHFDTDHVGGADAIVDSFTIQNVYTTYLTNNNSDVKEFKKSLKNKGLEMNVVTDTTFTLGDATFAINGPQTEFTEKEDNNSSLITMVTYGTQKYLFMGDAENPRIEEYLSNNVDADFLKVPYHGYYQDDLSLLFQAVTPTTAVMTNSSELPSSSQIKKTEQLLKKVNSSYYETKNGTIVVTCNQSGFTVKQ